MGEFTKEVGVFTALLSVGLFLAGTAAAGILAFPKQAQRLSHVLQTEEQQIRERLGAGLQQAREPYDAFPGQEAGRRLVNAGSGAGGAPGSRTAVRPKSPGRRPAPVEAAPPRQQLYGLEGSGAVMSVADPRPRPSLSEGASSGGGKVVPGAGNGPVAPSRPDKPAVTPIPGAFWLLGSGLAVLFAAKGGRHITVARGFHRNRKRQTLPQFCPPRKVPLTQPAQCSKEIP